ncbi:MAG TPA: TorF family putative porin, partial [Pseudomonadales bacterium]
MRKALLAASVAAAVAMPCIAQAQTPAATPAPDFTLTANVGLFSDYRFRGFTQTDYNPAIQGGFDFAHSSGFYLGNWNSNISSTLYNGAPIEMDFYGGYKHAFGDFTLDIGAIYYYYPGSGEYNPDFKPKNFEAYIGGSWG